jgi:hypothetical protein
MVRIFLNLKLPINKNIYMKLKLGLFVGLCFAFSLSQAQIYLSDNGLTASGSGTTRRVQFGGTLIQNTNIDLGSSFSLGFQKGTARYFDILNNGNIGFGTNAPTASFDVVGASRFRNSLTLNYGTANRTTQVRDNGLFFSRTSDGTYTNNITANTEMLFNTAGNYRFINNAVERFTILQSGNVGIGYATPRTNLDVNGYINANSGISIGASAFTGTQPQNGGQLYFQGNALNYSALSGAGFSHKFFTSNVERFQINDVSTLFRNTNVGIGTLTPTAKFHTNGSVRLEGLLKDSTAARLLSSDINGNLSWRDASPFGGVSTNIYNSDGTLTGDRTVTLGSSRLKITADIVVDSMRIGQGVVKNNFNLQFGVRAWAGNAGSSANIAIGTDAGRGMTTGSGNTLVGSRVGYVGPITGLRNSAYGQDVLYSLTTGNDNSVFGYFTGSSITSGINNAILGSHAGSYITTGGRNTIVGAAANGWTTSGASGSRNVYIGERSAYYSRGNDNVFIGWNAGNNTSYDTVSNRFIIENTGSLTPLISGDFLMDTLRIGGILSVRDNPLDVDSSSKVGSTAWVKNNFHKKIQWQSLGVNQGSLGAAQVINVTGGLTASISGNTLTINGTGSSGTANWNTNGNNIVNANVGFVGIGTSVNPAPTDPQLKLAVNGNIYAQKLKITQQGWPDYVFEPTYKLMPLSELEEYIYKNKHLPDVPSAVEVETKGLDLGDNQTILLKKIEELTLYVIELKKEVDELKGKRIQDVSVKNR